LVWELEKVIVDEDSLVMESVDEENLWAGWEMNLHRRIDPMQHRNWILSTLSDQDTSFHCKP